MPADPHSELVSAVAEAAASLQAATREISVSRPKQAVQGDYSTNAAMLMAAVGEEGPREIAERLGKAVATSLGPALERYEVAGPGFLNLFMSDEWYREAVRNVVSRERFGGGGAGDAMVLLEFVSANPTGPLTAAGGRGAAYGDSLARILEWRGHRVEREYYLNDSGSQIRNFAASISARMKGAEVPADGYSGAYVGELGDELAKAGIKPDDLDSIARAGTEAMRARIEATLERFSVRFDRWTSERALLEAGGLESTLAVLADGGHSYTSEGALWLRTTRFGDDKDRVLVRSDGEATYFATDIAYHRDKIIRGADHMIVPLGADHHGYVARMKAAVGMLAGDPDRYEAPIMQLVNIVERGERTRMSKRRGEFVTLDELIDDIGADAARFFLLARSHDSVIDLDLELARTQSQENPVYYVQYAHARIAGILQKAAAEGGARGGDAEEGAGGEAIPCEPSERALVRRLLEFPEEVEVAAERRAPHRICAFAQAVAADFHAFYRDCKVVGADAETGIDGTQIARMRTCAAAQQVIASCLHLIGVDAPERM
jgi:arginyl-tRNA synthetase